MRIGIPVLFLILSIVVPACGQSAAPAGPRSSAAAGAQGRGPIRALTLDQALAIADQNSPLLKQSQAQIEAARGQIQAARAYANPRVEFFAGHQAGLDVPTPGVPGLLQHYGAAQPLEIPVERRARIRVAQLELTADRYRMAGLQLAVMAEVKRAFYDVVRRKEQLANARDNLTLVEDLRRRVGLEVKVGEKGKLELTRAEAELSRAQSTVKTAEVALATSRAVLKAVIGMPGADRLDATGSLTEQVQLGSLDELRQSVLAHHPALAEAQARTVQAQANVADQRAKRIPAPELFGEYEHQPDLSFFRLGVSVEIPLWNKRRGEIQAARAQVTSATEEEHQRRLQLVAGLEQAYSQYEINNEQVASLQSGSLHEAEEAVKAARSAYKYGERGIVEVLDAQRVLQGVRTDLLDALYARQSALIDLEELGATHP